MKALISAVIAALLTSCSVPPYSAKKPLPIFLGPSNVGLLNSNDVTMPYYVMPEITITGSRKEKKIPAIIVRPLALSTRQPCVEVLYLRTDVPISDVRAKLDCLSDEVIK